MKILIGSSAGFIAFYVVDQALFGGRLIPGAIETGRAMAAGFGFYS